MGKYNLPKMEELFADLIWDNEPISTRDLVNLCSEKFDWKRTTTYTMLKRLIEKNIFQNDNGIVKSIISEEDFKFAQSKKFLDDTFEGSLPQFVTSFVKRNKLSEDEIDELKKLIKEYEVD